MTRRRGGPRADFGAHLAALGAVADGDRVVVALSGGLDSAVLLHLLLHAPEVPGLELRAAHLDHAMREGSRADAAWVRGLARAWRVPLHEERLAVPPASEADARRARYAFLEETRLSVDAAWILTAHHADDQAETVLFRALRGTGLDGLAGIPAVRSDDRLVRPLLPWWREELETYARRSRVSWRPDPSNRDAGFARNVVRHELLPAAEARVAPGARTSLVRLARLARADAEAWESVVEGVLSAAVEESTEDRIVIRREALLEPHTAVRARALRSLCRRLGITLDEAGTRGVVQFTSSGASGRTLTLPRGVTLTRDFDRLVLSRPSAGGTGRDDERSSDAPVEIDEVGEGEDRLALGERSWLVRWSPDDGAPGRWVERFHPTVTSFPVRVRGWRAGDRVELPYGSKKVAKLFAEARVAAAERRRRPVLEDARGRIVWVPGVARIGESSGNAHAITIAIDDADH